MIKKASPLVQQMATTISQTTSRKLLQRMTDLDNELQTFAPLRGKSTEASTTCRAHELEQALIIRELNWRAHGKVEPPDRDPSKPSDPIEPEEINNDRQSTS